MGVRVRAIAVVAITGVVPLACSSSGAEGSPDASTPEVDVPGDGIPTELGEADRQVLDTSIGAGHAEKVEAAGEDPELCAALGGAIEATMALDAASGEDLVALVGPSQEPMDRAAQVLAAGGFTLTAEHWARYRDALAETEADIDLADQSSRDRANQRFETVRALGSGSTASELGALATVCGLG